MPESSFDINNPVGDIWQVDGTASNLELKGADDSFKIHRGNLDSDIIGALDSASAPAPVYHLPDNIDVLNHHLSHSETSLTGWRAIKPNHIRTDLTRQFSALWDENRRAFGTDNYFDDITGIEVIGFQSNNIFYYADANDPLNTTFPAVNSYIVNSNVRIRNNPSSNNTPITPSFRKVLSFNYALSAPLSTGQNFSMLRIGSSASTPLIGLSEAEGLYLNIGRQDGAPTTRTVTRNLGIHGNGAISYPFGSLGGLSTVGEAEFDIPNSNDPLVTYPITFNVKVRLDNNGNDEGTFEQSFTITDEDVSQGRTTFISSHTGYGSKTWGIRFEHDFTHTTFGVVDVLFIDDADSPETNAALTYYVSVQYDVTETFTHPITYTREPINAGNGHDDFGLFDPHLYNTEHVHERNRVMLLLSKFDESDTSADPELAVTVIVDGEVENILNPRIRLHRPASDFDFNDVNFGNSSSSIAHIQCYDYEPDGGHTSLSNGVLVPTVTELQRLYNQENNWYGAFRNDDVDVETIKLDSNFELLNKQTFIVEGTDTSNRYEISVDDSGGDGNEIISLKKL